MPTNAHGQPVGDPLPGWTRRPLPAPVRLHGQHVRLEPVGPEHAEALLRHVAGPDDDALWTYRVTARPPDRAALETLLSSYRRDPGTLTFAVVPVEDAAEARGLTSYARIDPGAGTVEIASVLYGRALQRTPASTEATHLLMAHAFDDLGYRRVEWKCDSLNEPSRRAALRLGFVHEGRFHHHMTVKGRNRDTDWFAVTDADWPRVREAHRRWLDPDNHVDGRQRLALADLTRPDAP